MPEPYYLSAPDAHLDPEVAARYDCGGSERFSTEVIATTVDVLADLTGDGPAVEFAIGTGRIGVPLAEAGVTVYGLDFSEAMLAELRKKPGSERIHVTSGDMTTTQVCSDASLVYLVFNTIMNLRTQALQVACFRNAAAHLASGGRFLIETEVPGFRHLVPGDTFRPFDVSPNHVGLAEYVDFVNQISISHHYHIDGDRVLRSSPAFRWVWPSELDLMAELAGLKLRSRWADWGKATFTGDSSSHVSIWQKP